MTEDIPDPLTDLDPEEGADVPDEIFGEVPEVMGDVPELGPEDFIQQMFAEAGEAPPEPETVSVRRFWLDEGSFRAIAFLEQNGEIALILSDGEHQIVLYDSVSQPIEQLDLLDDIIGEAIKTRELDRG